MRTCFRYSMVGILLLGILAVPGFAQDKHGRRGPAAEMKPMKMRDQGMPCMLASSSRSAQLDKMVCMLTGKMPVRPGMMHTMMKKKFFLDRIEELGLQKSQVANLKNIQAVCRRDNLRTAAEVKIARFELDDLLEGDWTLDAAEKLIRKLATLEADMKIRHLAADREALTVLTDEQLQDLFVEDSIESLFED